jgi:hypothetical protein
VNPNRSPAIILFHAARFVLIPLVALLLISRFTILPPTSPFFLQLHDSSAKEFQMKAGD